MHTTAQSRSHTIENEPECGLLLEALSLCTLCTQDKRPFVLSRSFYAGSQRWGAIWTGDNACLWSHLEAAVPMLLTLGICGITFSGADVGGFLGKGGGYGDPDAELFTRWFQASGSTPRTVDGLCLESAVTDLRCRSLLVHSPWCRREHTSPSSVGMPTTTRNGVNLGPSMSRLP